VGAAFGLLFGLMLRDGAVAVVSGVGAGLVVGAIASTQRPTAGRRKPND